MAWVDAIRDEDIPVTVLPATGRVLHDAHEWRSLRARLGPHVVHAHGYRADIIAGYLDRRAKYARVATVHGFTPTSWKTGLYSQIDRRALRRFDLVFAVAGTIRRALLDSGLRGDRVRVVHNGVDVAIGGDRALARAALGLPEATPTVGSVGRLSLEKGHADLLHAMAMPRMRERRWCLILVGDGPCAENLKSLATSLGIADRVMFLGTRNDLEALYPAFDLFVLPSHTEGCPTALVEAMGWGLPVAVTAVGAVPDIVATGREGIVVPPREPERLAEALESLLEDPRRWRAFGRSARATYQEGFALAPWIDAIVDGYRSVARN